MNGILYNMRIARELVRIARSMCASGDGLEMKKKYYGLLRQVGDSMDEFHKIRDMFFKNADQLPKWKQQMKEKMQEIKGLLEEQIELKKQMEQAGVDVPKAGDYRDDPDYNLSCTNNMIKSL